MLITLYSFGKFDLTDIMKDLQKRHKNHIFKIGTEIKTAREFRIGFFRNQPIFDANLILNKLVKGKHKNEVRYAFTEHILVEKKSITSSLYGGLCWPDEKVLIMSTAV